MDVFGRPRTPLPSQCLACLRAREPRGSPLGRSPGHLLCGAMLGTTSWWT